MIAISVVGDDLGGKYKTFKFKDKTILNLLDYPACQPGMS